MRIRTKEIGLFIVAILASATFGQGTNITTFKLDNQSGFVVFEVAVSPDYDVRAAVDLLGSGAVGPGEQREFHMDALASHCVFNILVQATNGLYRAFNDWDLCEDARVVFDAGRTLMVSNQSRATIAAVQIRPDFRGGRGPNRLPENEVIEPGRSRVVLLEEKEYNNRCRFDIRLITRSSVADYIGRDLCDDMVVTFFEGNEIKVTNNGMAAVRSVRVSLDHESEGRGDELLGDDSLSPGDELTIRLHQFSGEQCLFDVLVEDDRSHIYEDVDVCGTPRLVHPVVAGPSPTGPATKDVALRKPRPDHLPPGESWRDCEGWGCPWMVVVEGGTFERGSWEHDDEAPVTDVSMPGPFAVGQFEVSVAQFEEFASDTGHDGSGCYARAGRRWRLPDGQGGWSWAEGRSWRDPGLEQKDSHPVVCVRWDDAVAYAEWLTGRVGYRYRLLTEAEAEFLLRTSATNFEQSGQANCRNCGSQWDGKGTSPVGRLAPNKLGVAGLFGNAAEWVQDCYQSDYSNAPRDGSAWSPPSCVRRVVRGGCWATNAKDLRASARDSRQWNRPSSCVGFRVATDIEP